MEGGSLRSPLPLTQDTDCKTDPSDCRQRPNGRSVRFSGPSVNSGYHFSFINSELVLSPYEATLILLWALRAQIISIITLCKKKLDRQVNHNVVNSKARPTSSKIKWNTFCAKVFNAGCLH